MTTLPITPPATRMPEEDSVMRLLGSDPWARWDIWAGRAWDAIERSIEVQDQIGSPMNADDGLDHRIISLFHASEVAANFADSVNPLIAAAHAGTRRAGKAAVAVQPELEINAFDTEELG